MLFLAIPDKDSSQKAERLYDRYRKVMYGEAIDVLCNRTDAEDAIQESFLRIMKNLHKIDEKDIPRTRCFLTVICRNVSLDFARRKAMAASDLIDDVDMLPDEATQVEDLVITKETFTRMQAAIDSLDRKYRDIFLMKYAFSYSRAEIAEMFGISVETVKKRLQRAKQMLLTKMRKEELPYE